MPDGFITFSTVLVSKRCFAIEPVMSFVTLVLSDQAFNSQPPAALIRLYHRRMRAFGSPRTHLYVILRVLALEIAGDFYDRNWKHL
jgi:hypothetical protein